MASLLWVLALGAALVIAALTLAVDRDDVVEFGIAWGIALAVLATVQLTVALWIESHYDPRGWFAYLAAPIYPLVYWLISAAAALHSEIVGLGHGPKRDPSVWDLPRETIDSS